MKGRTSPVRRQRVSKSKETSSKEREAAGKKLRRLETLLFPYRKVALAFSGGVDSTFLLAVLCKDQDRKVLALTALSPTHPRREQAEARKIARQFRAEHREIFTDEIKLEAFRRNPPDRCYHCKRYLFSSMLEISGREGFDLLVEGSNLDDRSDFRPGTRALGELGIRSPLLEARMTKSDIRVLSRKMGLPTWNKPSVACLASRFPYGTPITERDLERIDRCEVFLLQRVQGSVRVRYHESTARIEVDLASIPAILKERETIVNYFKKQGFSYVTLDLEGYRTGSLNEVLGEDSP